MANTRDTGEMVDDKKHGYWITYYASGLKRSEGNFVHGKKDGKWILYHKNGNISSVAYFRDDKYEGEYICYHENGNRKWGGPYKKHDGSSSDGRKEGVWLCWEEDGENVWRIITYKKGGAAQNRMNIRSVNATVAAKADVLPGAIIAHDAAQNLINTNNL